MRFVQSSICNFEWVEDQIISFDFIPTNESVILADEIRALNDCKDMARDPSNFVWYNFYLDVDVEKETVTLWFSCNNGEKDDYANYDIELSEEEKQMLMWKAFRQYAKEMDELYMRR